MVQLTNFFLGCAIWAYKDWVGNLFPKGTKAADFLQLYSRRFTTVEGNTTFYSIPDVATVERWAAQTPDGFQFCLKLPRSLTHQGRLADQVGGAIAFLQQMQGLGDRLGPLFAQLPPSYSPGQFADLAEFLRAFPRDQARLALEVRHPAWFQEPHAERLNGLLSELGMGRVLLDTRPIYDGPDDPQLHSERKKPRLPLHPELTAEFSLIRYISHPQMERNQGFLAEWVERVEGWLRQGKQIYFFVHCPVEERSPDNARRFQRLLEEAGVEVPALPWDGVEGEEVVSQLSLF